jgi:hypothetical protein
MPTLSYRTLGLVGLLSALGASGCVEAEHPAFTVGWDLFFVNTNQGVSCQNAGTPNVELTIINTATKRKTVNRFACDGNGGTTETLPGGNYDVRISLLNANNEEVSNNVGNFNLARDGLTDMGVISFEIQSFQVAWSIHRGGNSLGCQDVDAKTVNLVTRLNSEQPVTYSFPCTAGSGFSPALMLGTYSVKPQLVSSTGAIIREFDPMTVPVTADQLAVLTPVVFDVQ